MKILKNREDIVRARAEMRRRGIDCATSPAGRLLRKAGIVGEAAVGDRKKSWDVLSTVEFLERHVPREAPLLDIGAYASETPCALHRLGFTNLCGIDLNPSIERMPHRDAIRYVAGDFTATPFPDASFRGITAISVIEHGFDGPKLLAEISRLLRPGGFFVASVDYWPGKLDTSGIRAFGLDWTIFSAEELRAFLAEAGRHGLSPHGATEFEAAERVITWKGRGYTFAWMALVKSGADK